MNFYRILTDCKLLFNTNRSSATISNKFFTETGFEFLDSVLSSNTGAGTDSHTNKNTNFNQDYNFNNQISWGKKKLNKQKSQNCSTIHKSLWGFGRKNSTASKISPETQPFSSSIFIFNPPKHTLWRISHQIRSIWRTPASHKIKTSSSKLKIMACHWQHLVQNPNLKMPKKDFLDQKYHTTYTYKTNPPSVCIYKQDASVYCPQVRSFKLK